MPRMRLGEVLHAPAVHRVVLDRHEARFVRPVLEDLSARASASPRRPRDTRRCVRRARSGDFGRRSRSSRAGRSRGAARSRALPRRAAAGARRVALCLDHATADLCKADARGGLRHLRTRAVAAASTACPRGGVRAARAAWSSCSRPRATTYSASIRTRRTASDSCAPSSRSSTANGMRSSRARVLHHVNPLDEGARHPRVTRTAPHRRRVRIRPDRSSPRKTGTRGSIGCCERAAPSRTVRPISTTGGSGIPGLHPHVVVLARLRARYDELEFEWLPYLSRWLGGPSSESLEQTLDRRRS